MENETLVYAHKSSVQTDLFKEDWIGLRTLDEAGKVSYVSTPGNHMHITRGLLEQYVLPNIAPSSRRLSAVSLLHRLKSFVGMSANENELVYSPPMNSVS